MRFFILFLVIIMPAVSWAQEDKWQVHPIIGVDMGGAVPIPFSDIPKGAEGSPKLNPSLGLGIDYRFTPKWAVGLELSYHVLAFSAAADVRSQPFYFDNGLDILYFSGHTNTDVELRFMQIPVSIIYSLNSHWNLLFGVYYSHIWEGSFDTRGTKGVLSADKSDTDNAQLPGVAFVSYNFDRFLDKWDLGLFIGYRYSILPRLGFLTTFQGGFKSIFKPDFDNIRYEMYQFRLNAGLYFVLF